MIKTTLVSIIVSLMTSTATWAACSLPNSGPVRNVLFTGESNCDFAEAMAYTLAQVAQTFQKAPPVTLVIGNQARNASFDTGHIIRIPQRLVFADKNGQDFQAEERQLMTVVVHEYGHAILNEIWKKEFAKTFGEMFQELEELSTTAEQNLTDKISSRGVRQKSQQIAAQENYRLYYVTLPAYSELYADALAVYFFDDPSVMYKALYFPNIPENQAPLVMLRDFSRAHKLEDLIATKDDHTKLSLVRSYLGSNTTLLTAEQKRTRLDKLEKAITRSIQLDLASKKTVSIAEVNRRLIQFLQEP